MSVENRIREIRECKRLRQKDFGDVLGLTLSNVSQIEREKAKASVDLVRKIVDLFDISSTWLLTGEGEMFLPTEEDQQANERPSLDSLLATKDELAEIINAAKVDKVALAQADAETDRRLQRTYNELEELREIVKKKFPEAFAEDAEPEPTVELPDYGLVAAAGPVVELDHHRQVFDVFPVRESLLPKNRTNLFVGHIQGDSMQDIIPDGAKLLLRVAKEPISGRVYLFPIRGRATFKKFRLDHTGPHFEYMDGTGRTIYPQAGEQWYCNAEFLAVLG